MFFKKEEKKIPVKINRLSKMTTPEIIGWIDTSVISLGQAFDNWRYKDTPEEEVTNCINAISSMWDEILTRSITNSNK